MGGTTENPQYTDEWIIADAGGEHFSEGGDSGSFVWDTDGYVVGQLQGGPPTPIEVVLEDIRQACGAKKVELGWWLGLMRTLKCG